jgi:hypothetical protein
MNFFVNKSIYLRENQTNCLKLNIDKSDLNQKYLLNFYPFKRKWFSHLLSFRKTKKNHKYTKYINSFEQFLFIAHCVVGTYVPKRARRQALSCQCQQALVLLAPTTIKITKLCQKTIRHFCLTIQQIRWMIK